jgi:hypothetical protein
MLRLFAEGIYIPAAALEKLWRTKRPGWGEYECREFATDLCDLALVEGRARSTTRSLTARRLDAEQTADEALIEERCIPVSDGTTSVKPHRIRLRSRLGPTGRGCAGAPGVALSGDTSAAADHVFASHPISPKSRDDLALSVAPQLRAAGSAARHTPRARRAR